MNGRLLLTGATGFVGRAVLGKFCSSDGPPVRLLLHKNVPPSPLPGHIESMSGDLARPATLAGACDGVETILHLAGYIGDDEERCDFVNGRGTEALVELARSAGVRRFVYLSNAAVYGYAVHRNTKESDLTARPATAISRSRVWAEHAVLGGGGMVLRPLFVYGDGDAHFLPVILRSLDRFRFLVDRGRARLSVISVDDFAAILAALAATPWTEKHRGVFHVNDGQPVSFREIAVSLARCVGSRLPSVSVPYFMARAMLRLSGKGIFQKADRRSSAHRLFLVSKDHFYDSGKLANLISVRPGPPLPERLPQYADWYRRFVRPGKREVQE